MVMITNLFFYDKGAGAVYHYSSLSEFSALMQIYWCFCCRWKFKSAKYLINALYGSWSEDTFKRWYPHMRQHIFIISFHFATLFVSISLPVLHPLFVRDYVSRIFVRYYGRVRAAGSFPSKILFLMLGKPSDICPQETVILCPS